MLNISQDDEAQDNFLNLDHQNQSQSQDNHIDRIIHNRWNQYFLPFEKEREKVYHQIISYIDSAWLIIFAIITYSIADTCSPYVKINNEIIFFTFCLITSLDIIVSIMFAKYNEYKHDVMFLKAGLLIWWILSILVTFLSIFELIIIIEKTSGFNTGNMCTTIYYIILVNCVWVIILFTLRVVFPVIEYFV